MTASLTSSSRTASVYGLPASLPSPSRTASVGGLPVSFDRLRRRAVRSPQTPPRWPNAAVGTRRRGHSETDVWGRFGVYAPATVAVAPPRPRDSFGVGVAEAVVRWEGLAGDVRGRDSPGGRV